MWHVVCNFQVQMLLWILLRDPMQDIPAWSSRMVRSFFLLVWCVISTFHLLITAALLLLCMWFMCSGSSKDSGKPEEEDLPLFAVVNGEVSLTGAVRAVSWFCSFLHNRVVCDFCFYVKIKSFRDRCIMELEVKNNLKPDNCITQSWGWISKWRASLWSDTRYGHANAHPLGWDLAPKDGKREKIGCEKSDVGTKRRLKVSFLFPIVSICSIPLCSIPFVPLCFHCPSWDTPPDLFPLNAPKNDARTEQMHTFARQYHVASKRRPCFRQFSPRTPLLFESTLDKIQI